MEDRILKSIKEMSQDSPLRLFVEDELAFYQKYFNHFTSSVIREKKILEFENPNRMRVTYEFDVQKLEKKETPLFIFLPDTRKNWMKIQWEGKRLSVCAAEDVKQAVRKVLEKDLDWMSGEMGEDDDVFWERKIWGGRQQLPSFVNGSQIEGDGQLVVEYYDSFADYKTQGCLFAERKYTYNYLLEAGKSHWLYVKAPAKFQIDLNTVDGRANVIKGNDPEIKAYRIHHSREDNPVLFSIEVKVPSTLKWWYRMIVVLAAAYVVSFGVIGSKLICANRDITPVFAQVGISLVAAIIATRGWIMNDETVLKRVSNIMTVLAIMILVLLVTIYSVAGFK